MQGVVKWFNPAKGFGFINMNGDEIFIHYTGIFGDGTGRKNLVEGQTVEFETAKGDKGTYAIDVKVININEGNS